MANYLTLVNYALKRLNEVVLDSTTFATATGFQGAMKDAVNDSINDIYGANQEWPFTATTPAVTPSTGTQSYSLSTYTQIDWDSFRITGTHISPRKLMFMEYDVWLNTRYEADAASGTSQYSTPTYVFQFPNGNLGLTPIPETTVYSVAFNAFVLPTALASAADTCPIPDRWNSVITDGAMYYAFVFRDNIEMSAMAKKKFEDKVGDMRTELINRPSSFTTRYFH